LLSISVAFKSVLVPAGNNAWTPADVIELMRAAQPPIATVPAPAPLANLEQMAMILTKFMKP
jgi:hypothetical protein